MYQGKRVVGVQLLGGAGTRMWPFVEYGTQSKATLELAGKKLAYFNADLLEDAGIRHLVLPVQFNKEQIKDSLDFPGYGFRTSFTEADPRFFQHTDVEPHFRGTADAVLQSRQQLEKSDYMIIVPCDHITNVILAELIEMAIFNWQNYEAVITTAAVEKPESEIRGTFGNPKIDANGKVIGWEEKPQTPISNLASLGIYAGPTAQILTAIEKSGEKLGYDFGKNVLRYLREEGKLYVHFYPEEYYWNDVGKPRLFLQAGMDIIGGIRGIRVPYRNLAERKTAFGGNIKNCLMSVETEEPLIFGSVHDSVIGDGVVVDKGATVSGSILKGGNNVKSTERAIAVKNSILGRNSTVSDTNLDTCGVGRSAILHNCRVSGGKGIRIHPEYKGYDEGVDDDVLRESDQIVLEPW